MKRLEDHIRLIRAPDPDAEIVLRGSPNTVEKLLDSARRMATQWTWRGEACFGVSVHVIRSEDRDHVLGSDAYRTRHHYRWGTVRYVHEAGFELLPTFREPHHTVMLEPYTRARAEDLLTALPHREENPHYLGGSRR